MSFAVRASRPRCAGIRIQRGQGLGLPCAIRRARHNIDDAAPESASDDDGHLQGAEGLAEHARPRAPDLTPGLTLRPVDPALAGIQYADASTPRAPPRFI